MFVIIGIKDFELSIDGIFLDLHFIFHLVMLILALKGFLCQPRQNVYLKK